MKKTIFLMMLFLSFSMFGQQEAINYSDLNSAEVSTEKSKQVVTEITATTINYSELNSAKPSAKK